MPAGVMFRTGDNGHLLVACTSGVRELVQAQQACIPIECGLRSHSYGVNFFLILHVSSGCYTFEVILYQVHTSAMYREKTKVSS